MIQYLKDGETAQPGRNRHPILKRNADQEVLRTEKNKYIATNFVQDSTTPYATARLLVLNHAPREYVSGL